MAEAMPITPAVVTWARERAGFSMDAAISDFRKIVEWEGEPPNGAKIPNICRHFGIPCMSLEGFMEAEDWTF